MTDARRTAFSVLVMAAAFALHVVNRLSEIVTILEGIK